MTQAIRIWDIPGGIHPEENKHQSTQRGLETVPMPAHLILPLQQHIGAPAEPIVNIGDQVSKGQLIAEGSGLISTPLHAPTSGRITAIGPAPYPHASGLDEWAITLEPDGEERWIEPDPVVDYATLDADTLMELIRQAGVSGLGGAGFPTAAKLKARPEQKIHTLIINGTECEPYITADDTGMRYLADKVVSGIEILMHILHPKEVLIGIEDNKPEAIAAMQAAVGDKAMQVISFPTKYPSGGEKQLIQILTGKEVPSGGLPADIGMVCQNIGTLIAVHDAIILGQPLIKRIVTLTGDALQRPTNVDALIGTPIRHLLEYAGLQPDRLYRLVMGGPMMGFTLQSLDAPVIKTSNCLLAGSRDELPPPPPAQPCIRCGLCAEACPAELLPQQLHWFALGKDYEQLKRQHLFDCIECGACAYVCPSSIPLVQYYRASKAEIREQELQQHKAEHSKQRFEQRQARLQREAEQKERDRQAKAEKAARMKAAKAEATAAKADDTTTPEQASTHSAEPDLARLQAKKTDGLSDEQKQLKITAATARMALKKAQKQLTANPDNDDLQAQIPTLEQALEQAEQAYQQAIGEQSTQPPAPPAAAADDATKKLKIEAAMLRASLRKAERAAGEQPTAEQQAEIDRLREQVAEADARLPAASEPARKQAVEKKPVDETARQLKTDMAMAKAAFKKAERALADNTDTSADTLASLEADQATAKQALDAAAKAFAAHMASKETD